MSHGTVPGQKVDESSTSSKTTFDYIEDVTSVAFLPKDPSTGQFATRVDREVPRLESALAEAEDSVDGARTLAPAGSFSGRSACWPPEEPCSAARRRGGGGTDAGPQRERRVSEMPRPTA